MHRLVVQKDQVFFSRFVQVFSFIQCIPPFFFFGSPLHFTSDTSIKIAPPQNFWSSTSFLFATHNRTTYCKSTQSTYQPTHFLSLISIPQQLSSITMSSFKSSVDVITLSKSHLRLSPTSTEAFHFTNTSHNSREKR